MNIEFKKTTRKLATGYYKFLSLTGNIAEVEFKEQLTADLKVVCKIDITPLFDSRSYRPQVTSLYRKLITITSITLAESGQVESCHWDVLTLTQLENLKAKELILKSPIRVAVQSLSSEHALKLYDQIKANPYNILPDALEEQYTFDDIDSDDYEIDNSVNEEIDPKH